MWFQAEQGNLRDILNFILPMEEYCVNFSSWLKKGTKAALPSRREALVYLLASEHSLPSVGGGNIRALLLLTRSGLLVPVVHPQDPLSLRDLRGLDEILGRTPRKIFCIAGLANRVQLFQNYLGLHGKSIAYHLMKREISKPLEANLFPPDLHLHGMTLEDAERVFPLEVKYQHEEVLVHPERFNPAAHLMYFKRNIRQQDIFFATIGKEVVAKAGTNAQGFRYCQIGGVYTDQAYRGRGIARTVMVKLLEVLETRGQGSVLFVRKGNQPAVRLYQGLGFSHLGDFQITYPD
ncbi:MAG TPA: GNAT family N-acetyltransferase [Sediminispirochaeta sp.]|nr:GNAT family N-acetyltransferase [Sediminispirochaeta sp.]